MSFYCKNIIEFLLVSSVLSFGLSTNSAASSTKTPRIWASAEYLYWWVQDSPVSVPLITQNNNPSALGLINEPGSQVIFGSGSNNNVFRFDGMSGGRATIGGWLDDSNRYGLEGSGFGFPQTKNSFSASSLDVNIPVINIPFFSTQASAISTTPSEDVLVFHHPNTATVSDTFQPWGIELNSLYNLSNPAHFPLLLFAGFRYLNITEDLRLNDAIYEIPTIPNSVLNVGDDFSTKNNFYGFQIGTRTHFVYNKLIFDIGALIALGDNYQKLAIRGQTNVNNVTVVQPIGLFAEPSNIGTFNNNQFAVMPEIKVKVGYKLTENVHPFIAYNCLYINNIIRPGNEIDRNINLSQNPLLGGTGVLSGALSPLPRFNNTGIWMQGISAGIEFDV